MNVWPFVAVQIVLLIAFMVSTPPPQFRLFRANLPRSVSASLQPGALREDAIRISDTRNGYIFFRNKQVQLQDLPEMIRGSANHGSERKVYLALDRRTRFADATLVWDSIRRSGIQQICFIAE